MTPSPQEHASLKPDVIPDGRKKVVISGISGLYPSAHHVQEFSEMLYNKVDPISSKVRWKYRHPEVSTFVGNIPELNRFDAQFFKVHYRLGNSMDPMSRKILEQAYQAIFDAGLSPELLSKKKVSVFIGTCTSESEKASFYLASTRTGFGIVGCCTAMYANRISYWLNLKGPSQAIDGDCCSSTAALEQAYLSISRGDCDAAIVGGSSLCLHPQSTVHCGRTIVTCKDGKTKSFDKNADGCVKTEAIVVLLLQKADDALRVYAEVVHAKTRFATATITTCETGQQFGFTRNPLAYEKFLNTFYKEANVKPEEVEYVEAYGTADPEADKSELDTISKVFCQGRTDPLLVGSVISNVGYTEAASGVVALTKILLGYHRGELAANAHLTTPRKDIPALQNGCMRVVAENQPFGRTYTAFNNLSVSGGTAHVLLHGQYKPKDPTRYQCSIPRLVTISGRHEAAAQRILKDLKSRPIDPEELALLHNAHTKPIAGHLGKAFIILGNFIEALQRTPVLNINTNSENQTVSLVEACEYFDNARRPLWFVYSGMGSQWAGMGVQLMRIPIFAGAIERCQKVLQPKGIDLLHIITTPDKSIFDNILNSFVGIAAIQIGLTDVLRELGLVPDKIIGHSVGELGCAYADGCLTAEEMILSAYSRGLVSIQTPFIRGSMAAVGVSYNQVIEMVPSEIEVACHNSAESSTISGPADVMKEFVASLSAKGIFAKEVPCSNIAYHSRYIADAGPGLLKYLSEVIKDPKPRSERWVSTSVPMDKWDEPSSKYSSAEYHTNNLLNPVLFEETSKLIPANAVLVEIAPHGLLQAILKRSLPLSCKNIPLTRRGHPDNALFFLEAIGRLFMEGYNPQVAVLYPRVEFPVSTGTPMLSHLVEWEHNEIWNIALNVSASVHEATAIWELIVSVQDDESSFLRGHVIREKNVYPFAGALVAAWDTLSMTIGKPKKQVSVKFSEVNLFVQPALHEQKQLRLTISLHRGTGKFEILDGPSKVATGYVQPIKEDTSEIASEQYDDTLVISSEDVYQMFYERDYDYRDDFRSIHSANPCLTKASVRWSGNWVTFIDGLLQINAIKENHDGVSQPNRIRSMVIDVKKQTLNLKNNSKELEVQMDDVIRTTRCGGVMINDMTFKNLMKSTSKKTSLNELRFVPHFNSKLDKNMALQVFLQIVAQNVNKDILNVVEIKNYIEEDTIFNTIKDFVDDIPGLKVRFTQWKQDNIQHDKFAKVDLVLVQNLALDDRIFELLYNVLPRDTFLVIAEETSLTSLRTRPSALYKVVSTQNTGDVSLHLSHWRPNACTESITAFTVRSREDFTLLSKTRDSLPSNHKLLVLSSYPPVDGVQDLVASWRKEEDKNNVHLVMINYNTTADEDLNLAPELDLAFNVLNNSIWGGEYYLPLIEKETKLDNMTLKCEKIGDLSSLHWVETPLPDENAKGITVDVHYAGLNTLDAKRATGVYSLKKDNTLDGNCYGMDFSGITSSGTKVMGIVANGACTRRLRANPDLMWPVPNHWNLEEAASVPLPYAHAFYCLMILSAKPVIGHSLLIHGGAGALGQAAISISLANGCRVFTTVSDVRKKHFLRKLFPELKEDHIGCSRDSTFGDMVMHLTNGEGVSIVLNCVPGDLKNISMKCVRNSGIIFDTVQIPSNEDYTFGMNFMTKERSYIAVDFSSLFTMNNRYDMRKLQVLISEGISRGYVRPLSKVSFPPHEAARAIKLLEASRHRGRVLLRLEDTKLTANSSIAYSEKHKQLVVSNDAVIGLQLVDRLLARGARSIQLIAADVPTLALRKEISWKTLGAEVIITTEDLSDSNNIQTSLKKVDLDSVEGLFLVSSKTSDSAMDPGIVRDLDQFARKHTNVLRYFAVLSDDPSLGNETCYKRASDKLPATKLCLPLIKQVPGTMESPQMVALNWRQALDSLERALRSTQPVVYAYSTKIPESSLLEKISAITGVQIPDDTAETSTLRELGVTQQHEDTIRVLMRDEHNLWLPDDNVLSMTVLRTRELQQAATEWMLKPVKGLEVFFSHVDSDELMATTDMVFLTTLTSKTDDEFDVNKKYLCIVPGLEGNYERFRELSERLKLPALVLQAGLDRPHDTIKETAQQLSKTLLKKAHVQDHFYLLGYESGIMVALELAAIMEERGLTGTVFCIGSSPEELKATLEDEFKEFTSETALQEAVIRHMFSLMTGSDCDLEFKDTSTWQEKMEYCLRTRRAPLSAQYVRAHFEAAYGKIVQVRQYEPSPRRLRSNIVLLRTNSNRPIATPDPMQQYSQQPITVHNVRAPLAHVLKDLRCASIINQHLHPHILKEFETKNLCERFKIKSAIFGTPEEVGIVIE